MLTGLLQNDNLFFLKEEYRELLSTDDINSSDVQKVRKELLAKDPESPIFYALDWSNATHELIWHVIYGANRDQAKLKVAVNASSGEFIRVEK